MLHGLVWFPDVFFCSRRVRGEKEAGHIGTREVGNVDPKTELTFQFGANEHDAEGEKKLVHHH